jgi:hypothetical protein
MAAIVGAAAARGLGSAQRDVKADRESLARTGEAMTTAAMAAYAYSKSTRLARNLSGRQHQIELCRRLRGVIFLTNGGLMEFENYYRSM